MMHNRIDLHTHSTASDGEFSPSEVVALALERELDVIALTDHDSAEGLPEAWQAAAGTSLTVLAGVELATTQPDDSEVHLLGYLFDTENAAFRERLHTLRDGRLIRARKMVEKLSALGAPVALERVLEIAGSGSVGRPHVARALLEAGHISTLQEAFDRFIADGGPAYVPRERLTLPEAIAMLHAAGGVAVLAHPIRVPNRETLIPELVAHGLDGLEVYYPDHDEAFTAHLRDLAHQYDLIMTGGTDFHRVEEGGIIRLGTQSVPPECVPQLQARAAQYRAASVNK